MGHLIYFLSKLEKREILKIIKLVINSFVAGILEIISLASLIPLLHVILKNDQDNSKTNLFGDFYYHELSFFLISNNDLKNINQIFNKNNLKVKKIFLKKFIEGTKLINQNNHQSKQKKCD